MFGRHKKQEFEDSAAPTPIFQMRLPGFVKEEQIGLGDVIRRATYAAGFKPCAGCEARARELNRWMMFSR